MFPKLHSLRPLGLRNYRLFCLSHTAGRRYQWFFGIFFIEKGRTERNTLARDWRLEFRKNFNLLEFSALSHSNLYCNQCTNFLSSDPTLIQHATIVIKILIMLWTDFSEPHFFDFVREDKESSLRRSSTSTPPDEIIENSNAQWRMTLGSLNQREMQRG